MAGRSDRSSPHVGSQGGGFKNSAVATGPLDVARNNLSLIPNDPHDGEMLGAAYRKQSERKISFRFWLKWPLAW